MQWLCTIMKVCITGLMPIAHKSTDVSTCNPSQALCRIYSNHPHVENCRWIETVFSIGHRFAFLLHGSHISQIGLYRQLTVYVLAKVDTIRVNPSFHLSTFPPSFSLNRPFGYSLVFLFHKANGLSPEMPFLRLHAYLDGSNQTSNF
jgi:hypothetical protein